MVYTVIEHFLGQFNTYAVIYCAYKKEVATIMSYIAYEQDTKHARHVTWLKKSQKYQEKLTASIVHPFHNHYLHQHLTLLRLLMVLLLLFIYLFT